MQWRVMEEVGKLTEVNDEPINSQMRVRNN
jgi:hypothetical protein